MQKTCNGLFAVLLGLAATAALGGEPPRGEWIPLFNGKNLDGWKVKIKGYELGENWGDTFRVEDGVLKVAYDRYEKFNDRFGHLFYEKPFSNYILRVEYRFVGQQAPGGPGWAFRNNGIMLHGQPPETMGKDQSFPVSIEVQLLGGSGQGRRPTANVCSPGTHFVQNGKLTATGLAQLKQRMPHADFTNFEQDPDINKMAELFRVQTIVNYVKTKVA